MENIKCINNKIITKYNKYIRKTIFHIKNTIKIENFLELFYIFKVIIARTINNTKKNVNGLFENSFEGIRYSYENYITRITGEVGIWTN
jgi:hypothetical protein